MQRHIILALSILLSAAYALPSCVHVAGEHKYDLTPLVRQDATDYSEYEVNELGKSIAKYKWNFCGSANVEEENGACGAADVLAVRLPLDGACEVVARVDDCEITSFETQRRSGVAYKCLNHQDLCAGLNGRVPREFIVSVECDPSVEWSSVPVPSRSHCETHIQAKSKHACVQQPVVITTSTTSSNRTSSLTSTSTATTSTQTTSSATSTTGHLTSTSVTSVHATSTTAHATASSVTTTSTRTTSSASSTTGHLTSTSATSSSHATTTSIDSVHATSTTAVNGHTTSSSSHGTTTSSSHGSSSTTTNNHATSSTTMNNHATSSTSVGPSTSSTTSFPVSVTILTSSSTTAVSLVGPSSSTTYTTHSSTTGGDTPLCCIYNITKSICTDEQRCPQLHGYQLDGEFRVSSCQYCTSPKYFISKAAEHDQKP